jgi:prepilin-type N-terminal cleavage/methylation domain-containing protein
MKRLFKDNSGYSLVELIIVLAIIAVLSGMGALTISVIRSGRATATKDSFDTEIAALLTRTKSQSSDTAILIKRDGNKYNIYYGTSTDGTSFTANDATKADVITNNVDIYYTDGTADAALLTEQIIKFNKSDGSVKAGYGTYTFCKSGSDSSVGSVTINKATGSHYTGK